MLKAAYFKDGTYSTDLDSLTTEELQELVGQIMQKINNQ